MSDCKVCSKCSQSLPLCSFYKGNASYGKMSWCKDCARIYAREDHRKNPEKRRAIDRKRLASPVGRAGNIYRAARRRALAKGVEFSVSLARIERALVLGVCEKTGIPFDFSAPDGVSRNPYAASIDRIDPFDGYTDSNVQIVVSMYNLGKSQFTDAEFVAFCKIVAARC